VWLYAIVDADSEQEAHDIAVKHLYTMPKTIEYEIEEVEDYYS